MRWRGDALARIAINEVDFERRSRCYDGSSRGCQLRDETNLPYLEGEA
jgi:hypothetical protein